MDTVVKAQQRFALNANLAGIQISQKNVAVLPTAFRVQVADVDEAQKWRYVETSEEFVEAVTRLSSELFARLREKR
jgi:hypothetical protein